MNMELEHVDVGPPDSEELAHDEGSEQRLEEKGDEGNLKEEVSIKKKKCKKKEKHKIREQKGEGDEWGQTQEDDEWGEGELIQEAAIEDDDKEEGANEIREMEKDLDDVREGEEMDSGEEEFDGSRMGEEETSEESTTCSESEEEEPRPLWDDLSEDEVGFLLLSDPGIYEALQLKEREKQFSPDGMEAYLEMCKHFAIPPITSFLKQLFANTVDVKFYGASAKNIRSLALALKYNPYVKTLDLTETQMDRAALYEIAELIRENTTLHTIILKKCNIGPDGAKYLGDTLDLSSTLQNLDLAANALGDEGVEVMAPAIGRNTALKSLDLSYNGIGQRGAKALGAALQENQTLSELKLRWNNLFEDVEKGLKALLSALSRPEIPMERLDLAWNALGESSAIYVRALMVKAPQLRDLCLDHNRFPDAGTVTLKRGLLKAPKLEIFRIGFNPMTSEAAHALLSGVTPQLKILDLSGICVKKNFLALKTKKLKDLDVEIIHGEPLSAYIIEPVDMAKLMLKRARFEGLKSKKKKKKKDFGHLLLEFDIDRIRILDPDDFIRRLRAKKMKIREELVRGIMDIFKNKWGHVNVERMLDRYMELFPDTQLPPPKPKKEKKKKKKGKKTKKT